MSLKKKPFCPSVCLTFFESADARDLGLMTLFFFNCLILFFSSSVNKVIDWLLEKGEHRRTYNVLFDSCHHFARRLFETTAKTKGYPDKLKLSKIILGSVLKADSHAKLKRE